MMIGNFIYCGQPRPDDVTVWLHRGAEGAPSARLLLPSRLTSMMAEQSYPPPSPVMSLDSALSYAVFLAMRARLPLVISGDRSLWQSDWGYLTDLGQFSTVGLLARSGFLSN